MNRIFEVSGPEGRILITDNYTIYEYREETVIEFNGSGRNIVVKEDYDTTRGNLVNADTQLLRNKVGKLTNIKNLSSKLLKTSMVGNDEEEMAIQIRTLTHFLKEYDKQFAKI